MTDSDVRFRGRIVTVSVEHVRLPNGAELEMEVVEHPGGAAIVAIDAQRRVCLLRQYRHVIGDWLWELPAGKRDNDEDSALTAVRELQEEAGVTAATWVDLGKVISSPGVFTEVVHLFMARDLQPTPRSPEHHEVLEVHWLDFDQALQMAQDGDIRDAKTLIGLYRAQNALTQ
ncbi:MAG: NUDIX hydrolase [Gammaproteobacteria bacterium SG8_47]|nr:MAG: NUDIX hydrolase [Gammaproteobacteria bacterium SG8_47]